MGQSNATIWLLRDTYPYAVIWLVRYTWPKCGDLIGAIYMTQMWTQSDWCEQHTTLHANLELYFFIKKKKKKRTTKKLMVTSLRKFLPFLGGEFINLNWMWRKIFALVGKRKFHENCSPSPFPAPSSAGTFKQITFGGTVFSALCKSWGWVRVWLSHPRRKNSAPSEDDRTYLIS